MLTNLDNELLDDLAKLRATSTYRELGLSRSGPAQRDIVSGTTRRLLLCGNNYLGLAADDRVICAAVEAAGGAGVGSTGSRLISGNHELLSTFESEIASFKGYEAALVFSSGYLANIGVITALVGVGDLIISDALNHASIIDGCRLSRAEVRVYRHLSASNARELLADRDNFRRALLVTDGVFSMDGDVAPLPELVDVAREHNCVFMVDDAHGFGVLGPTGRGTIEHFGLDPNDVPVLVGTLSKALGAIGGVVCGSSSLRQYLINFARTHRFATACSPVTIAGALAALRIVAAEGARLSGDLRSLRQTYAAGLKKSGVDVPHCDSAIIPIILGENAEAWRAAECLSERGIWVQAIVPPTVPRGTARLRTTLSLSLSAENVEWAASQIGECI
ncbi:MAG TPA: 8-amino-7-oxononanoate synthase [Thermoanaerobaculia bacterium]|nr:8-amino-7-oxononanoate synthase [Thermoanaerobaculia bacterium]